MGDGTVINPKGYAEVRLGDGTVLWSPDALELIDDFNDENVSEYSGNTSDFGTTTTNVLEGAAALQSASAAGNDVLYSHSGDGLGYYPQKGDVFASLVRNGTDTVRPFFGWGVSATSSTDFDGYALLHRPNDNEITLRRYDAGSPTDLDAATVTLSADTWYDVEVEWHDGSGAEAEDTLTATIYSIDAGSFDSGADASQWRSSELASVSAVDSNYAANTGIMFGAATAKTATFTIADFYRKITDVASAGTTTQLYFSDNHVERPWQANGDPNAIYVASRDETYIAWHAGTEAWATRYDHAAGTWADNQLIGSGGVDDYHGAPSMTVDADGFVHVIWGSWAGSGDMIHAVSDSAYDITSWTTDTAAISNSTTYPLMWNSGTAMYAGFRLGSGASRPFGYYKTTDNGATWSSSTTLIDYGGDYWIYCNSFARDGSDIHLFWREFDNSNSTATKYYHGIFDTSDDSFRAIDGTALSIPLGRTEAVNNCEIADVSDATFPDFFDTITGDLDGTANPYCACHVRNSAADDYRTYFTHHDGTSWSTIEEVAQGYNSSNESAGFHSYPAVGVESSTDVDIVLAEADPNNTGESQVARYNWDGSAWSQAEVLLTDEVPYYGATARVFNADASMRFLPSEYDGSDRSTNDRTTELKAFAWGDSGIVTREW